MTGFDSSTSQIPIISIETRYGTFFIPEVKDLIGDSLREYGEWAQAELDILCDFISAGDTVVDGGACFGTHARAFSAKTGPSGRVICFEPADGNRTILDYNVAAATIKNIDIRACALGEEKGAASTIGSSSANLGGTRITAGGVDDSVAVVRLDEVVVTPVNFMKLDLEGSELSALRGASRILSADRPIVFLEVLDVETGAPLMNFMGVLEYVCYGINTPAFRFDNFRGSSNDIFQGGTECGLLFLHASQVKKFVDLIEAHALPQIVTLDDLVLLLLQQPQYCGGTLAKQAAAHQIPLPIPRHETELLAAELSKSEGAVADLSSELLRSQEALADRTADFARSRTALAARWAELINCRESLVARSAELELVKNVFTANKEFLFEHARRLTEQMDNVSSFFDNWQVQQADLLRLVKRVRAFPFGLYFRLNKRHRRFTRRLLRSPEVPLDAKRNAILLRDLLNDLVNELGARHAEINTPVQIESVASPHSITLPGSWRASVKDAISSVSSKAILSPLPERNDPVLDAEVILVALAACRDHVVVSLSHDDYRNVTGGTQLCVQMEANCAASSELDYLNIHPVRTCNALLPMTELETSVFRLVLNGECLGVARYAEVLAALSERKARAQSFHFVVHHLLGHSPEAIAQLIEAVGGRRCYFWLHDYFASCRGYTLLRNTLSYCGGPPVGSQSCRICIYGDSRTEHTQRFDAFFDRLEVTALAPSRVAAKVWIGARPYKLREMIVQPHATLVSTLRSKPLQLIASESAGPIRIAFVGSAVPHKGWPTYEKLVAAKGWDSDLEFHYFGKSVAPSGIIVHYTDAVASETPDAMTRALAATGIDLVIHMAPWPETFSLTTVEALASYAYVVTHSRSGNVADLVRETGRGKILEGEGGLIEWIDSEECRSLVKEGRERRRTEILRLQYSDMSIGHIKRCALE